MLINLIQFMNTNSNKHIKKFIIQKLAMFNRDLLLILKQGNIHFICNLNWSMISLQSSGSTCGLLMRQAKLSEVTIYNDYVLNFI